MRTTFLFLGLAIALASTSHDVRAEKRGTTDNGKTIAFVCAKGDTIEVAGNNDTVTATGDCATVRVSGNQNTVQVDLVGAIEALGNSNTITWKRGPGGHDPSVSNPGNGNAVRKAN